MVEKETSVYDESPPLVHATFLNGEEEETIQVDAANIHIDAPHEGETAWNDARETNHTMEMIPMLPTERQDFEKRRSTAAGIVSGVVGLLLGGPFLGLALGLGTVYVSKKEGPTGDAARAIGEVGLSIKEKATEIDQKHKVVNNSKVVAKEAWEKAKQIDKKHRILESTKKVLIFTWNAAMDFIHRHRLIERGIEGLGRVAEWVAQKLDNAGQHSDAGH